MAAVNLVYFMACAWCYRYRFKKSDSDNAGARDVDLNEDHPTKKVSVNAAPV
jgi:hypothetical protein